MVRTPNIGSIGYAPNTPPDDPAQLQRYLLEEFARIAAAINLLADGFDPITYVAPAKPRAGMRRYADGTSWNPGSGAGIYRYTGAAWVFVG